MKNQFFTLFFLISSVSFSQDSLSVLFIGNSYTYVNDLPTMLSSLTVSLGDKITFDSKSNGGFTFANQVNDPLTFTKLHSKPWDYVVIQGQSQEPSFPTSQVNTETLPYAVRLADSVYSNKFCSQAMYFMTWGREVGDPQWDSINSFYKMNDRLRAGYLRIADSAQASVSPVGSAWRYVRDNNPTIQLYSGDGSHPSVAGSYLSACTFYASLYRKSPVGATYDAGLDATTVGILQHAAAITVLDSLDTWHLRSNDEIAIAHFTLNQNDETVNFVNSSWRATDYSWNFGDGNVSSDESPIHTYANPGIYVVELIASNECGEDTLSISLEVLSNSIAEGEKFVLRQVAPSIYKVTIEGLKDYSLISSFGQVFHKMDSANQIGASELTIDLSSFPVGMYFLQIKTEEGIFNLKLLK
jgi:PKD repeat protein